MSTPVSVRLKETGYVTLCDVTRIGERTFQPGETIEVSREEFRELVRQGLAVPSGLVYSGPVKATRHAG